MDPAQIQEFYQQYFYHIIAASVLIGLIFGAIPLTLGFKRGKKNLGWLAFILAGVTGALSPFVAIILATVFVVIILKKGTSETNHVGGGDIPS